MGMYMMRIFHWDKYNVTSREANSGMGMEGNVNAIRF